MFRLPKNFTFSKLAAGKIPSNFKISTLNVPENVKDSATVDFKLWILARRKTPKLTNKIKVLSFIAMFCMVLYAATREYAE